jgi:hypothetical protein
LQIRTFRSPTTAPNRIQVKQKISGGFRKAEYAKACCRIFPYLQTMAHQGANPLIVIPTALSDQLYAAPGKRPPFLDGKGPRRVRPQVQTRGRPKSGKRHRPAAPGSGLAPLEGPCGGHRSTRPALGPRIENLAIPARIQKIFVVIRKSWRPPRAMSSCATPCG